MHRLLCSTGALLGRANGRDFRLLPGFSKQLRCDGLELMFYDSWYQQEEAIWDTIKILSLPIVTFHAEKNICQELLNPETAALALDHFHANCRLAHASGAEKIVFHLWDGYMNHDQLYSMFSFLPELNDIAENEKLLFTVENVVCSTNSPLFYLQKIHEEYPGIAFTYDTKMAAFHFQEEALYASKTENLLPFIRHFHINDYSGGYMEWPKFRTLHPGEGKVDFERLFSFLRKIGYREDFTTEATSFNQQGIVDIDKLNRTLDSLRQYISKETDNHGPKR